VLDWDGQNPAREQGEASIRTILDLDTASIESAATIEDAKKAARSTVARARAEADKLKRLGKPFLNWSGKAERLSFDVPTLPLFVHERLSTKAIIETLKSHEKQSIQADMFDLFGDPRRSVADQVLKAYEYKDKWVNRLVLGDSLVVMNSLLNYEGLGGQVQVIYIDPPYGVKFGSNFQPFVRNRDVSPGDDDDMTREPEMVKAYRDTWELGLHSYLSYIRDRLLLTRELLNPSGSVFVQISDENLHHVRELLDEIFGSQNFVSLIPFRKKTMPLGAKHLESVNDYLLWYARDLERLKYHALYVPMNVEGDSHWNYVEFLNGTRRKLTAEEIKNHKLLPSGSTPLQLVSLYPAGVNETGLFTFTYRGKQYKPPTGNSWFTNPQGMQKLADANRLEPYEDGETLRYVLKLSDAPYTSLTNFWTDTSAPSDKHYVVQTSVKVVQRCILMTTDPGDLVFDPTCGGGTTALVAERWGRRWITVDTSRVPLALTRQSLLTATFP
jgi:adenine-specific DNA-methyltransferase